MSIERAMAWLDAVSAGDVDLAPLLAEDMLLVEHPNLVNPRGSRRDKAACLAGADAGRGILAWQRFDDRRAAALPDGTVVIRATWRGRTAKAAGMLREGQELTAHLAMFLQFNGDGQLVRQETYDCYDPLFGPIIAGT